METKTYDRVVCNGTRTLFNVRWRSCRRTLCDVVRGGAALRSGGRCIARWPRWQRVIDYAFMLYPPKLGLLYFFFPFSPRHDDRSLPARRPPGRNETRTLQNLRLCGHWQPPVETQSYNARGNLISREKTLHWTRMIFKPDRREVALQ